MNPLQQLWQQIQGNPLVKQVGQQATQQGNDFINNSNRQMKIYQDQKQGLPVSPDDTAFMKQRDDLMKNMVMGSVNPLGGEEQASIAFGKGLRNSSKALTQSMHPEDIKDASNALERYFTHHENPLYYINHGQKDENVIKLLAEHYIGPDVIKANKRNPLNIAQELMNRVMVDRKGIGQ